SFPTRRSSDLFPGDLCYRGMVIPKSAVVLLAPESSEEHVTVSALHDGLVGESDTVTVGQFSEIVVVLESGLDHGRVRSRREGNGRPCLAGKSQIACPHILGAPAHLFLPGLGGSGQRGAARQGEVRQAAHLSAVRGARTFGSGQLRRLLQRGD